MGWRVGSSMNIASVIQKPTMCSRSEFWILWWVRSRFAFSPSGADFQIYIRKVRTKSLSLRAQRERSAAWDDAKEKDGKNMKEPYFAWRNIGMYDLYDPLFFLQGVECPCGDWSMGRHKPRPQLVGFCPCSESKVSQISCRRVYVEHILVHFFTQIYLYGRRTHW